jgi:hypothetical protein
MAIDFEEVEEKEQRLSNPTTPSKLATKSISNASTQDIVSSLLYAVNSRLKARIWMPSKIRSLKWHGIAHYCVEHALEEFRGNLEIITQLDEQD